MRKKRSFKVNRCYHLISRIAHRAYFFDEGEKGKTRDAEERLNVFGNKFSRCEYWNRRTGEAVLVTSHDGVRAPSDGFCQLDGIFKVNAIRGEVFAHGFGLDTN